MPRRHFLPIALALFACCVADARTVVAQTTQDPKKQIFPDPAQTPPQKLIYPAPAPTPPQKLVYPNPAQAAPVAPPPAKPQPDPLLMRPMQFYQAHGAANACGPGCSEWIAAEGKIDADSADRLRHLLGRLGAARPPMFLYSPGGSALGSMELGRLVRARKMTVSVGHTVPLSCESDPASENSCEPQIKAGHAIEAELDPGKTMCNSGCVYVVAGGAVRLVPPWVTLGIHDVGFLPREHGRQFSAEAIEYAKSIADGRLRSYMREMGIDDGLWKEAIATPFSSLKPLFRDDIVRFGMDRRDFAETVWHFVDRSGARIVKLFFVGSSTPPPSFVDGFVEVSCGRAPGSYLWVFGRNSVPTDTFASPPVNVSLNDKPFRFLRLLSNPKYFVRSARLAAATAEGVAESATIVLPGSDYRRQEGPAGDVTLAMLGFPAAFAKLQDACAAQIATPAAPASAQPAPAAQTVKMTTAAPVVALPAGHTPPSFDQLPPGTKRSVVDSALGVPARTIGTTALYPYMSFDHHERKVMAGYFDASGKLQRFERYVLKDGKVFGEVSQAELNEGRELPAIRTLLTAPNNAATGLATPPTPPASPQ